MDFSQFCKSKRDKFDIFGDQLNLFEKFFLPRICFYFFQVLPYFVKNICPVFDSILPMVLQNMKKIHLGSMNLPIFDADP